jgi:N-acetylneuraminic acid mutarotase
VNGKIYAIGGIGGQSVVEEYDPTTDTWTRKADMPSGRGYITSSVVDGKIYVIGGNTAIWGTSLATVEMYDPSTDTWTRKADMTTPRDWLASCVVNGKIYAMGGDILPGGYGNYSTLASAEVYDPETNTWTPIADMHRTRRAFNTVVVDDKIYAVGGFSPYAELYEPVTATWVKIAAMPKTRMGAAASVVDGKIYVFGGEDEIKGPPTSVVYEYDPATDSWTTLADMPYKAFYMSSSVVDGKVFIIGGSENVYPHNGPHLSTVWEYVPQP